MNILWSSGIGSVACSRGFDSGFGECPKLGRGAGFGVSPKLDDGAGFGVSPTPDAIGGIGEGAGKGTTGRGRADSAKTTGARSVRADLAGAQIFD